MNPVGRLDRYVLRTVLGSYGAGLLFMFVLFTSIDMLLSLGGYLAAADERGVGFLGLMVDLARYYGLFLPVVFVMVAPFVSVIAGMFAVSSHMGANELVPMVFTGRSMVRVLRPVLGMGLVSALAMGACWEFLIPSVTDSVQAAKRRLEGSSEVGQLQNLVVKIREAQNQTLYIRGYDHAEQRIHGLTMLERGAGPRDLVVVTAPQAVWDGEIEDWRLIDGEWRSAERARSWEVLGIPGAEPDLLWRLGKGGRETLQLSYSELLDLQALRPGRNDFVLAFHGHITFPIANLVLLLLALPFAVHFERGSRMERVVFAVLVCGAYLVLDLICQSLGRATLHPLLAAWLPTIVFGSLGVVFFGGMRT